MIDQARKYLGQFDVGFTIPGQCVAFFNQVVKDVTGLEFPIKGANTAYQILSANNTRPDLFEQVKNNPSDPNQLPSIGDWVIWDTTWAQGMGHIACVESLSVTAFTSIEQNYVANKVTRQTHDWSHVAGWIHYKQGEDMIPDQDNYYWRYNKAMQNIRGRSMDRSEFKANFVGRSHLQMLEAMLDSPEADNATANQQWALANRANVEKQIADLKTALANEQAKPPKEVIKEVEKIVEKIVEVEVVKEVEPSWLIKIREWLNKFLKGEK